MKFLKVAKNSGSGFKFEVSNPYSIFTHCYDDIMRHVNYSRWADFIIEILAREGVTEGNLLDIGCGTGKLIGFLEDRNFKIEGVDISSEMVEYATTGARKRGSKTEFFQGDMRDYRSDKKYDAVLSLHDSVNYLLYKEELNAFFATAESLLRLGGILVFDVSSRWNVIHNFAGRVFTEDKDDYSLIWRNRFNRFNCKFVSEIEFLLKDSGKTGKEVHEQRIYPHFYIKRLLKKQGAFRYIGRYRAMELRRKGAFGDNVTFVAEKL